MQVQALILDLEHHILMRRLEGREAEPIHQAGSLLELAAHFAPLGIELPPPVGVDPPFFVFLLEDPAPAETVGYEWVPIGAASRRLTNHTYWGIYTELMLGFYSPPTPEIEVFSFGDGPRMASRISHLVIKGQKRATSANPAVYKKLSLPEPKAGLVSIVTDGFGTPLCCIETDHVDYYPFYKATERVARAEGEGDLSLDHWKASHLKYFSQEAKRLGLLFDEASQILTEWFRVLKVFAPKGQR